MSRLDLHAHTCASDGIFTPDEVLYKAKALGLDLLAITDHDTVDGMEAAAVAAKKYGVALVAGIEFSAQIEGELHILGYGIDCAHPALATCLQKVVAARDARNQKMLEKLQSLGYDIDEQALRASGDGTVGRIHMARLLAQKGYAPSPEIAFDKFLQTGKVGYVPRERLPAQEVLQVIQAAGGLAVLAHPAKISLDPMALRALVESFCAQGLWGIEVFHPSQNASKSKEYIRMAKQLGLVCTAGSDFHGGDHGARMIVHDTEAQPILRQAYETMLQRRIA